MVTFCVLEPKFDKAVRSLKIAKTRDSPALANKVHERDRRETRRSKQLFVKTALRSQYQRLCEECQSTLEIWNERRAEVCHFRVSKKEEGDELLRLQAKFALAYAVLQHHAQDCLLCQLVSRMEGRDPENNLPALSGNKFHA